MVRIESAIYMRRSMMGSSSRHEASSNCLSGSHLGDLLWVRRINEQLAEASSDVSRAQPVDARRTRQQHIADEGNRNL
jgi:hypothetical protein